MLDPALIEAIYRGLRAVALVTGALVAIDSVGVLFKPVEYPPHRPKANALAWLIASISVAGVSGYLTAGEYGLIGARAPHAVPIMLYGGLIVAFTIRAITRAHRPWLTVISACCMSCLAVFMAWQDVAG